MAITSIGYEGSVNEQQWGKLAPRLGVDESVGDGLSASVLTTSDRTVRLGPGFATGWGVHDISDTNVDLQAPIVSSGSRWDTVAIRRTWKVAAVPGFTTFVVVQGTSAKTIAAGLNNQPGVIEDQPIYLIRSAAGQTLLQEIFDIRQWASAPIWRLDTTTPSPANYRYGQLLVQPADSQTVDLLIRRGTAGTESWTKILGPEWKNISLAGSFRAVPNFGAFRWTAAGGKIHLEGSAELASGANLSAGTVYTIGSVPAIVAPERTLNFNCLRERGGVSMEARVAVSTTGAITIVSQVATAYIYFDSVSWFPA